MKVSTETVQRIVNSHTPDPTTPTLCARCGREWPCTARRTGELVLEMRRRRAWDLRSVK